jgi:hypothetical protein
MARKNGQGDSEERLSSVGGAKVRQAPDTNSARPQALDGVGHRDGHASRRQGRLAS